MRIINPPQSNPKFNCPVQHKLGTKRLIDAVGQVFVLAYRENTNLLEGAIATAGFQYEVLRQTEKPEYQAYAAIYRCMLNHQQAWLRAAQVSTPTLILEADFVPVMEWQHLPLPFNSEQPDVGIAWLYTCAPQIYSVTEAGFVEGGSTSLVAYIVTPQGATHLCSLIDEITHNQGTGYYNFDSDIDRFLIARGFRNYIGFRNYGEHGGKPNPEHRHYGLSGIHRADVLYGKLAFAPQYLEIGESLFRTRLRARLKGIGRLFSGKMLRPEVVIKSSMPLRLIRTALWRQCSIRL